MKSPAYRQFIKSMKIGYLEWHEGTPYDLEALGELEPQEAQEIEKLLISRKNEDWRDAQALAKLGTARALTALEQSLQGPNREVRLMAGEYLYSIGRLPDLSAIIVEALQNGQLGEGLAEGERLAAEHASEPVKEALISGALHAADGRAVRFAALLYYLHGISKEPFDWNHRPLFLRFKTNDRAERRAAFEEMCRVIGIDGKKWLEA